MKVTPRLLGTSLTLLTLSVSCNGSTWNGPQNLAASLGKWFKVQRSGQSSTRSQLAVSKEIEGEEPHDAAFIESAITQLPHDLQDRLAPDFYSQLESWLHQDASPEALDYLAAQLQEEPFFMPVMADHAVRFQYTSPYDQSTIPYTLRAPTWDRDTKTLVLLLGSEEDYSRLLPKTSGHWLLNVPSRPHMNYQLLAEGDLWHILDEVHTLYPQTQYFSTYLVAVGEATDAGLALANHYRSRFSGLAFSGFAGVLQHPNLDHMAITHFSSPSQYEGGIWNGKSVITRLQARGNKLATSTEGELEEAIASLKQKAPHVNLTAPFTFEDYQYSQVWPWLKVLSKWTEDEPSTISCQVRGDELLIEAKNVRHVELNREPALGMPAGIKRARFNNRLYAMQSGPGSAVLGEGTQPLQSYRKADAPPGVANFFRNEPLFIVYQDTQASETYLTLAKAMAERLAAMRFTGLPTLEVTLPRIPLSKYDPDVLHDHRAILIGQPEFITPILSRNPYYFPVDPVTGAHDTLYGEQFMGDRPTAIALVYPPEEQGRLRLAMLLSAATEDGLEWLSEKYSSATTLYDLHDLRVWKQSAPNFWKSTEEMFDAFWCCSSIPSLDLQMPGQPQPVWQHYLQELITSQAQVKALAISALGDPQMPPPDRLTVRALQGYLPNRHFAVITLTGSASASIGNKILSAMDHPILEGLEDVLKEGAHPPRIDEVKMRKRRKTLLVDDFSLARLTPEEANRIQIHPLPYSLHELVFNHMGEKGEVLARDLLHSAQEIGMAP